MRSGNTHLNNTIHVHKAHSPLDLHMLKWLHVFHDIKLLIMIYRSYSTYFGMKELFVICSWSLSE